MFFFKQISKQISIHCRGRTERLGACSSGKKYCMQKIKYVISLLIFNQALEAAVKSLDQLNKEDINELRQFQKPPELVRT